MEIITGYTGTPHITAEQDRDVNKGIFGEESYVLRTGSELEAELVSNNELKIRDGVIMHQGCAASIKKNTYDPIVITNGSQGMKRIDLVVARYTRNSETKVESVDLKILQGTPTSYTPSAPAYVVGDIQAGDLVSDMPLYKITLNGLNVTSVEKMFSVIDGLTELNSNLMNIKTYSLTLNTSNVNTPDSWIECNRIGNLVMINGCAKITKAVNAYTGINIASGAPEPCCSKPFYTMALPQDNTYASCFAMVSNKGDVNIFVRFQKAQAGDVFIYQFCYICK